MQCLQSPSKSQLPSRLSNLVIVVSSVCLVYLLLSLILVGSSKYIDLSSVASGDVYDPTTLEHIVFGIASNENSWPKRKEYVKLWWEPRQMRGCVFLESMPEDISSYNDNSSLPPVCVSADTSSFRYTFRNGLRSAIRVARVVVETVALNHSNVRWYVFGDDDTVFFPENLVKTLSKYDHGLWYYLGTNSEIYEQNRVFGFEMAFGGAGFAISYPLAKVLAKTFDSCIQRYPHLYGSDSRIYSCMAELGIGLTREPGFHQMDVRGDIFGLLTSHPVTPLVSLHHFDYVNPIFPNMTTLKALELLLRAVKVDSLRILQRTICYDRWFSWTISVSWGYAIEVYGNHIRLPDLLPVQQTFNQWKQGNTLAGVYTFNTRVDQAHPDPCRRPTIFFLDRLEVDSAEGIITSHYKKSYVNCSHDATASPRKLDEIKVLSKKLHLSVNQLRAPRRHCCDVLPSSVGNVMEIGIRECRGEELIHMH